MVELVGSRDMCWLRLIGVEYQGVSWGEKCSSRELDEIQVEDKYERERGQQEVRRNNYSSAFIPSVTLLATILVAALKSGETTYIVHIVPTLVHSISNLGLGVISSKSA